MKYEIPSEIDVDSSKIQTPEVPASTQKMRTPLRYQLLNMLGRVKKLPVVEQAAVQRAVDLVERSEITDYFKDRGVYLDLGTGPGHIMEELLKETGKDVKIMALDPWAKPFRSVQDRLADSGNDNRSMFVRGAGQQLPIVDHSLDGVSLYFITHHLPEADRAQLWNEVDRVLKDDGNIFLIEDTPRDEAEAKIVAEWDRKVNYEQNKDEGAFRSDAGWKDLFAARGYELVHEAHFADEDRGNEVPHSSYVLRRAQPTDRVESAREQNDVEEQKPSPFVTIE